MTVKELFMAMETSKDYEVFKNELHVYDTTGRIFFGTFQRENPESLPYWLTFCEVESFSMGMNSLWVRIKDFRGDLTLKKEFQRNCIVYRGVKVTGFDYHLVGGASAQYEPEFINIFDGDKTSTVKIKDGGFKYRGYQYYLRDVIKY